MRVILAFLAQAANSSDDGKLNALGIFNEIFSESYPTAYPEIQIVFQLEASAAESGETKEILIRLMDADGKEAGLFRGTLLVPEPTRPGVPISLNNILALGRVTFERAGAYAVVIIVDDNRVEIPLHAILASGSN